MHRRVLMQWLACVCIVLLSACDTIVSQAAIAPQLDPSVLTGRLSNDFSYMLRSANSAADNSRLELRLVVKAGSLHERDSQRGYAHLVEHMAYRGTKNFSAADIDQLLENNGLRWGVDVNATTHYGATVYRFSLHQDDQRLLPELFSLMSDWLHAIDFDPAALEREKKIIRAEWRERYAERQFVVNPVTASAYSGSPYSGRAPAGELSSIALASVDSLQTFWHKNYRADNATLIVTGLKEPWAVEPLIAESFSALPVAEQIEPADFTGAAAGVETGTLFYSEGEVAELQSYVNPALTSSQLSVNFISEYQGAGVEGNSQGRGLQRRFYNRLLFEAFNHVARGRIQGHKPCRSVSNTTLLLDSGQSVERLVIDLANKDLAHCLSIAKTTVRSIIASRLTVEEYDQLNVFFELVKDDDLQQYRDRNAVELADNLVETTVSGEKLLSVAAREQQLDEVIDSLSYTELNKAIGAINQSHRIVYSFAGKSAIPLPLLVEAVAGDEQLALNTEPSRLVQGKLEIDNASPVMPMALPDSPLKTIEHNSHYEWQLPGGSSAILVPDDQFDYIALTAIGDGGYEGNPMPRAVESVVEFLKINGVNGYTGERLVNLKAQNAITVEPFVDAFSHGVKAYGSAHKVSLMLSLVDSYSKGAMHIEPQTGDFLKRVNDADNDHKIGVEDILSSYQTLFGADKKYAYIFVGNISPDVLAAELTRLTRDTVQSTVSFNGGHSSIKLSLVRGAVSSQVSLALSCNRLNSNAINLPAWELLNSVIERQLRLSVRESSALSYEISHKNIAASMLQSKISFLVAPDNTDDAVTLVNNTVKSIIEKGITENDLLIAKRKAIRAKKYDYPNYLMQSNDIAVHWLFDNKLHDKDYGAVSMADVQGVIDCLGDGPIDNQSGI